jgi:adenine deaminase
MIKKTNALLRMGGGITLADRGRIVHALSLPEGGIMSDLPVKLLARQLAEVNNVLKDYGSLLDDPFLTISYLTLTSIIELRLTVSGVYDVKKGEIIF